MLESHVGLFKYLYAGVSRASFETHSVQNTVRSPASDLDYADLLLAGWLVMSLP